MLTVNYLVTLVVLVLLTRASITAWHNRRVAVAVWRRIRPRHVLGSLGLLVVVFAVAVTLVTFVPVTQTGLGTLVGVQGNVVFAPIEDVLIKETAPPEPGGGVTPPATDWGSIALVTGFCVLLLTLFPWLAYTEERMFREGLEHAGLGRQLAVALRFGLTHLLMLIPLAAALAIGVAGFTYGVIYRRAYRQAAASPSPRAHALLTSTVWHTTFNSLLVVLLLVTLAA